MNTQPTSNQEHMPEDHQSVVLSSHLLIRDPRTGEILINKRTS
jgi:hypothetical protein